MAVPSPRPAAACPGRWVPGARGSARGVPAEGGRGGRCPRRGAGDGGVVWGAAGRPELGGAPCPLSAVTGSTEAGTAPAGRCQVAPPPARPPVSGRGLRCEGGRQPGGGTYGGCRFLQPGRAAAGARGRVSSQPPLQPNNVRKPQPLP